MHRKPRTAGLWAVFFYLLAALPGLALAGDGYEVQPPPRGMAMPAIIGTDLSGRVWKAADMRGKSVLINFWATWCEPCRAEMPSLQALQNRQGESVVVLAVNYKESPETVRRFAQREGWTLPIISDPQGVLAKRWGIGIFPTSVLADAQGRVRVLVRGECDWGAVSPSSVWYKNWLGP
jgi:thiol-disulfide isomerase/thioredoxin